MRRLSSLSLSRMLARAADGEVRFKLGNLELPFHDVAVLENVVTITLDPTEFLAAVVAAMGKPEVL